MSGVRVVAVQTAVGVHKALAARVPRVTAIRGNSPPPSAIVRNKGAIFAVEVVR